MKNHKPKVSLKFAKQLVQFVIREAVAGERPFPLVWGSNKPQHSLFTLPQLGISDVI